MTKQWLPVCNNCQVIAVVNEHYYNYNHWGWECPVCKTTVIGPEELDANQLEQYINNLKFFNFILAKVE
jgi:hypothetical protein